MSVVTFPPRNPKPEILNWRCNCGCSTHFARDDGALECANCFAIQSGVSDQWRKRLPEAPPQPLTTEGGDVSVVKLETPENAVKRLIRRIDHREIAAFVVINRDGSLSAWGDDITTPDEITWLERRMADAMELLRPRATPTEENA